MGLETMVERVTNKEEKNASSDAGAALGFAIVVWPPMALFVIAWWQWCWQLFTQ
jgi:hypothetical protein